MSKEQVLFQGTPPDQASVEAVQKAFLAAGGKETVGGLYSIDEQWPEIEELENEYGAWSVQALFDERQGMFLEISIVVGETDLLTTFTFRVDKAGNRIFSSASVDEGDTRVLKPSQLKDALKVAVGRWEVLWELLEKHVQKGVDIPDYKFDEEEEETLTGKADGPLPEEYLEGIRAAFDRWVPRTKEPVKQWFKKIWKGPTQRKQELEETSIRERIKKVLAEEEAPGKPRIPTRWNRVRAEIPKQPPATWQQAVMQALRVWQRNVNKDAGFEPDVDPRKHKRLEEQVDEEEGIPDGDLPPPPTHDTDPGEYMRTVTQSTNLAPDAWDMAFLLGQQAGLEVQDGESDYDKICEGLDRVWPLEGQKWADVIRPNMDT